MRTRSFAAGALASLMLLALSIHPPAFGAFHLEYEKGAERQSGALRIPGACRPQCVERLAPRTRSDVPETVREPVRYSQGWGGCSTGPGTPPASILRRENPMNSPTQYNLAGSSASGCWQITRGTWGGYGGYANAADAPVSVQNEKAAQLWAGGSGCGHWAATGGCG